MPEARPDYLADLSVLRQRATEFLKPSTPHWMLPLDR
ncbi:hypothetical protein JOF48_001466 [Arthrobacter stackebrandtii]|uniref:Uncharacterized protein n=1 Tax=Arthrobacter stackebrandtii TaxID=272161 RepID=A0ABS4YV40_9MICC|nr:hypothetical protein [Arthrobacter stackebrandtii]